MTPLALLASAAHAACDPVPVVGVGADAHAVAMAEVGELSALAWVDAGGGHLVVVDAEGNTTMAVKALGPVADVLVLGDANGWVAVTRTSQWAGREACRVEATRVNRKGNRAEHRTLISDACPRETPSLAAVLRDGTLIVAATTADPPGASSRDLRITRWAPAPAIPQPLDAVYVEPGLRVDGLAPTADGLDLYWSAGTDHRRSTLDHSGVPRGPAKHSSTPFVTGSPEPGDWVAGPSGRGASIANGALRFHGCTR
jgi:hypothetical protein